MLENSSKGKELWPGYVSLKAMSCRHVKTVNINFGPYQNGDLVEFMSVQT